MRTVNFTEIVKEAWYDYDPGKEIASIYDISAMVSTNHVFKIEFNEGTEIIAKLSYFGKFEHFEEDHQLINILANELASPYDNFLSKSLTKNDELYTYRYKNSILDVWVVFYQPILSKVKLPKKQDEGTIKRLGEELGRFHMACDDVSDKIPKFLKTMQYDMGHLLDIMDTDLGKYLHRGFEDVIKIQVNTFFENIDKLQQGLFHFLF